MARWLLALVVVAALFACVCASPEVEKEVQRRVKEAHDRAHQIEAEINERLKSAGFSDEDVHKFKQDIRRKTPESLLKNLPNMGAHDASYLKDINAMRRSDVNFDPKHMGETYRKRMEELNESMRDRQQVV